MFTYDSLLAAVLLIAPPRAFAAEELAPWRDRLRLPLRTLACVMEIADVREAESLFQSDFHFHHDLTMLQQRRQDLLTAPYAEECRRFPGCQVAKDCLAINRAMRGDLMDRLAFDRVRHDELTLALMENEHLGRVWEAVRDLASPCYYVSVRRQGLKRLRDLIGAEAFYRGQLPGPTPAWLLPRER